MAIRTSKGDHNLAKVVTAGLSPSYTLDNR